MMVRQPALGTVPTPGDEEGNMTRRLSPNHHWVAPVAALATGADHVSLWLTLAPTVRALRFSGRRTVRTDSTPESCLKEQLIPTNREVVV